MTVPYSRYLYLVAFATTLLLYAAVCYIGQGLLFGAYQFLRDRGYDFWSANLVMTTAFTIMAVPALHYAIRGRKRK